MREKLLLCLDKEIPHGTAIEVTKFSERENGIIDMDVTIFCEKASHKGIIIGKNGAMLRKIGEMARTDIEAFAPVSLLKHACTFHMCGVNKGV